MISNHALLCREVSQDRQAGCPCGAAREIERNEAAIGRLADTDDHRRAHPHHGNETGHDNRLRAVTVDDSGVQLQRDGCLLAKLGSRGKIHD